jgi:hypothetical protein
MADNARLRQSGWSREFTIRITVGKNSRSVA